MITTNERAQRMIEQAPDYYQASRVYNALLETHAKELDTIETNNADIRLQLNPLTATWGLLFWEERLGLPLDPNGDTDKRRKKILARRRAGAPFSGAMLKSVIEAYTERPVTVTMNMAKLQVEITMDEEYHDIPELYDQVDSIIHAHLGVHYRAVWLYESGIDYSWQYSAVQFSYQKFASTTTYTKETY